MAGGNATFGKICVAGSGPCQIVTSSAVSQVDYLAPGATPSPNPFSIVVTSASNSSLSSSTQVYRHQPHCARTRRSLAAWVVGVAPRRGPVQFDGN